MAPPFRVRAFVAGSGIAGLITIVVAAIAGRHDDISNVAIFCAFAAALALSHAFPLFMLHRDETEAMQLDEAFLVAMALLLPAPEVVIAFAVGTLIGHSARRRGIFKTIFNVGESVTAAGISVLTINLLAGSSTSASARTLAVIVGALVFLLVQSAWVSMIISLAEGRSFREALLDGMESRLLVWSGTVSAGLLAGLVARVFPWALAFAVVPIGILQFVFNGHLRARRDRQRMNGLFEAAVRAHSSIGIVDVEAAIAESAKSLLRCSESRFDNSPPNEDELGARFTSNSEYRWLIVSSRRGVEPFDAADRSLIEAIVAIGAAALDNASLFQQTRDERKKLADVVDSSSDGIFALDNDERITIWSPAMEEISGYRAEEMVGTGHLSALRPRDADGKDVMSHGWTKALKFPSPSLQVITRTGELRWLSCTFSSLPNGGCVIVARDVTAEREADELKSDFLGTVSHELRTPLTPIQGFLQTLLRSEHTFTEEERIHFYEIMLAQSERLGRLVEQILDAVSIQERRRSFVPEPIDIESSARDIVELVRRQHPNREFVFEVERGLPAALADQQRIEQVLSNLINNSIKYGYSDYPIKIAIRVEDAEVITTVSDRGPGVSPADRERIFERFTRLGDHLTRRVGGVGLGLYISRKILEAMGGRIWVEDAPEGGASFTFSVPAHQEPKLRVVAGESA